MLANRNLVSLVSLTAVLATVGSANAAVVYRANINLAIPTTATGVFVDLNGNFASGTTAIAGWDINIFGTGTTISLAAPGGALNFMRLTGVTTGSGANLPINTPVNASASFGAGDVVFGNAAGNWTNNGPNFFGFRFNIGTATHYGWGRLDVTNNGASRVLKELGYENVAGASINVCQVPAPGALALLGLAGLAGRRRRA